LVDAWLLRKFPGRTLDELDNMDWLRLMRALEADRIEQAEVKRKQYFADDHGPDWLSDDQWEIVAKNDKLLGVE
jgi:hypothetical protein